MILQPLIENAIRHGVSCAREGGWVAVAANQKDGILEIQVRNSVGGKSSSGTGVGLRNTEARLKHLYSGDAHLRLTVSDDRTGDREPDPAGPRCAARQQEETLRQDCPLGIKTGGKTISA
jgi:LytS/YehU family sensor histidine kinase